MSDNAVRHQGLSMEGYSDAPTAAHPYLAPTVIKWLRDAGAETVLDLGCGNGTLTMRLAAEGFRATGIDGSESGMRIAQQQAGGRATFRRGWIEDPLPPDLHHGFDAVIAIEVIEHLPRPRVLCQRVVEALRPSGRFILSTPYHGYLKNVALALANQFDEHWHPLRDGGHIKFFSPATLTELLRREGFTIERLARRGRVPVFAKSMTVEAVRRDS